MYDDPSHIHDIPVKIRLNDAQYDAVRALARLNGRQLAAFCRDLLLQGVAGLDSTNELTTAEQRTGTRRAA